MFSLPPRSFRVGAAAVAGALLLAACGGDDDTAGSSGDTSATPTSAAPATSSDDGTETSLSATPRLTSIAGIDLDAVASALDDRTHGSFPEPRIDPDTVRSGGPPPDGIPPIDDPQYDAVADVDFLADAEPVLALEIDGDARAFPLQIMTWHEIVNDTIGGVPVTVSFCPLCNSAVAFERDIEGTVFDFGTSGSLFNSSLVMYDRQTETLWTHFDGKAVIGALTGIELAKIPVQTVSWADFKATFPDGRVLNRDTGFSRRYGENPYVGYDNADDRPFLFSGDIDGRLAPKERVVAVRGDETKIIPTFVLEEQGAVAFEIDGRQAIALFDAGTASALDSGSIAQGRDVGATGVFEQVVEGDIAVDLAANGDGTFTDQASGSVFDLFGRAIDGPLVGSELPQIEALDTFWFAIAAFEPDAEIIGIG